MDSQLIDLYNRNHCFVIIYIDRCYNIYVRDWELVKKILYRPFISS